ncbi:MAG: hypothetical protein GBAus27B_000141 [Mycoplasmataceae bacterium]|nr:MAG: hypothetical protein GBAus27B_000141 [Mycoplasmataceae bacterium]
MNQTIIHPSQILAQDFLIKNKLNTNQLAQALKVSEQHLIEICEWDSDIDTNIAYRLAFYFQNDVNFWLDLQRNYDLGYWNKVLININKEIKPYQTC